MPNDMSMVLKFNLIDNVSQELSRMGRNLRALGEANNDFKRNLDGLKNSATTLAVAGGATYVMARGLQRPVDLAGELQAAMLDVRAELMGGGRDAAELAGQMKAIASTAFTVQATTSFNQADIVRLEKELIKSGARVNAVVGQNGAAAAAAALAEYDGLDPARAGRNLIAIGTPFQIAADGYMNLADAISRASSASVTSSEKIAQAAVYAAGPLASLGYSHESMLTISALLAQVGAEGEKAGTATRAFFREAIKVDEFVDAKGNLKEITDIIDILREKTSGLGSADKGVLLQKLFGEEGSMLALGFLREGENSFEAINAAIANGASLQTKLNMKMQGFKRQVDSFKGTTASTFATLFQPALKPLTTMVRLMNEFMTATGRAASRNAALGESVSNVSLGAVGLGSAITAGAGVMTAYYARRAVKSAGGFKGLWRSAMGRTGGLTGGIVSGKAVEAATGVTPVFVTNWPDGLSGLAAGGLGRGAGALSMLGPMGMMGLLGAGVIGAWMIANLRREAHVMTKEEQERIKSVNPHRMNEGSFEAFRNRELTYNPEGHGVSDEKLNSMLRSGGVGAKVNIHMVIDDNRISVESDDPDVKTTTNRGRLL